MMVCDECKYYNWYTDLCEKWKCTVDEREVHNCFEAIESPILDTMTGKVIKTSE